MDERELFVRADQALRDVVAQIPADGWETTMPGWGQADGAGSMTVRDAVNGQASDDAWVPDMLAGRTIDEVGKDRFAGDLLGDDPEGNVAAIVARSVEATLNLPDLDRVVHCSFGDFSARDYLAQITSYRGLGAYDIARTLDLDDPLQDDELAQGMLNQLSPVADEWRGIGVLPPAVPVPDDAPARDRLLGLAGRRP